METDFIEIILNGIAEKVQADTDIARLLADSGEKDAHLIVEVNNRFIFPQQYHDTPIRPGDKVEFIHPDFGG
jgi:thiamine biosynthesis protein ThiS